jgi:aryl-alcohol dehydrogenase-like predicted oxidoreductase
MALTAGAARAAGDVQIGDLTVPRLGFGAMRLPGPGVWGPPADRDAAIRVVRRAIEHGVRVIDTAWYYGLDVANEIIAAAIHPYPEDLVLVTKLGAARSDDGSWSASVTPEGLRAGNEHDLRGLRLDAVPVTHLRWMDQPDVSFAEALGTMIEMRKEGKIQRIGLSNVTPDQLEFALGETEIVTVSNHFGPTYQADVATLERCEQAGIAYLPFFPLAAGGVSKPEGSGHDGLTRVAAKHGVSAAQASIAWLLARSPIVVPIPGTSSVDHLDENVAATAIRFDADDIALLSA